MTDHDFIRRMNILVLEGMEFMKEGMIRMKAQVLKYFTQ